MKRALLLIALIASLVVPAVASDDLRMLTPAELVANSTLIARAHVTKVEKSKWASFRQVAKLELVDVLAGDGTDHKVRVAARWMAPFVDDQYEEGTDVLVFLTLEPGLYRTVNYQYGMFPIENEMVMGWRNNENIVGNAPYAAVREEVGRLVSELTAPAGDGSGGQTAGQPALPDHMNVPASAPGNPQNKPAPGRPTKIIRPERP